MNVDTQGSPTIPVINPAERSPINSSLEETIKISPWEMGDVCANCGEPMFSNDYFVYDGEVYHEKCLPEEAVE